MKFTDLIFNKVTYQGDYNYFFTINERYHGYTWDYTYFHVTDETTKEPTSYPAAEFKQKLESGFFGNGGKQTAYTINENENNNFVPTIFTADTAQIVKTVFIVAVIGMIIYIAAQK
jgi:hypothetical protein